MDELEIAQLQAALDAKTPLEQAQLCEEFALLLSHIQERRMRSSIVLAQKMDSLISDLVEESKAHRTNIRAAEIPTQPVKENCSKTP